MGRGGFGPPKSGDDRFTDKNKVKKLRFYLRFLSFYPFMYIDLHMFLFDKKNKQKNLLQLDVHLILTSGRRAAARRPS